MMRYRLGLVPQLGVMGAAFAIILGITPEFAGRSQARAQPAGAKVALLPSQDVDSARNVVDLALVKLGGDKGVVLLERAAALRLLQEQKLSFAGLVDANTAVKAGKILAVDLLAVIDHSSAIKQNTGVVLFDAVTGVRLLDIGFTGTAADLQARETAAGVRQAIARWRAGTKHLKTLCFLPVRNADLPRSRDLFCETLAAMLERDALGFEATAVLERKRLDLVNQEKTLAQEAATREVLASLVILEMEISRGKQGKGIRAGVTLRDNAGKELQRLAHEVDDATGAGLLAPLSEKIQQALKTTALDAQANRDRESQHFLREAKLLWDHRHYLKGLQAAEAAFALKPSIESRNLLAEYLLRIGSDIFQEGGMFSFTAINPGLPSVPTLKVAPEKVHAALDTAGRGLELLEASRKTVGVSDWNGFDKKVGAALNARRTFFNKLALARIVPEHGPTQREFEEFRLLHFQRLDEQCHEPLREALRDAKTLDPVTYLMQSSVEETRWLASSRQASTKVLHRWAMTWLEQSKSFKPEAIDFKTAARFGQFLGEVYQPHLRPGPGDADLPLEALEAARKHPHPVVRLHAEHMHLRLMARLEKLSPKDAIARHHELLAEGKRLIEKPPFGPHDKFRVTMYRVLNHAIGHLNHINERHFLDKTYTVVSQDYFDLCDFMLAQGDVIDDVLRAALMNGPPSRARSIKALQIIDKALELAESPKRRHLADQVVYVKNFMEEARRKALKEAPDLLAAMFPWESITPLLAGAELRKMRASLLATVVHEKHIFIFIGVRDPESKHKVLQLLRMPVAGGAYKLIGKAVVGVNDPQKDTLTFWLSPESFVTCTAIAHDKLYVGTTRDGILAFPLAGGDPVRIGEKEGLPSRFVNKLAIVNNTLVAALDEAYLISYDLVSGRCDTIASSRRSEKLSPFDNAGPFRVYDMSADPQRNRILFTFRISSNHGLWEFNVKTRAFKKLQPHIPGAWSTVTDGRIYIYWTTDDCRNNMLMAYELATDRLTLLYGKVVPVAEYRDLKATGVPADLSLPFRNLLFQGAHSLWHQGSIWKAHRFGRCSLDGKTVEHYPWVPEEKRLPFYPNVTLQAVSPNELLIGDMSGLYLVRLKSK